MCLSKAHYTKRHWATQLTKSLQQLIDVCRTNNLYDTTATTDCDSKTRNLAHCATKGSKVASSFPGRCSVSEPRPTLGLPAVTRGCRVHHNLHLLSSSC